MQATPGSNDGHTPGDDQQRAIPDLLTVLAQLMRAARIAPHGSESLTPVQWATLGILTKCGELRVSAIAEHMRVDLSVASRQMALLEEAGCVSRAPDPADRRAMLVKISPEGSERLAVVKKARVAWLADALSDWTPEDIHDAAITIDRIQEALWTHDAILKSAKQT